MSEASIISAGTFEYYSISENGITFQPNIPKKVWLDMVANQCALFEGAVLTREKALAFLADTLNAGEQFFGEEFAQSISAAREYLGLSPKTIANAQWTYQRIAPERRKIGITLGHYSVIAALDEKEQDKYCDQILTHKMTISDLKEIVAEDHPKTSRGKSRKTSEETEATALQKAEDVIEWIEANGVNQKWKIPLEIFYKAFRRNFIARKGRK